MILWALWPLMVWGQSAASWTDYRGPYTNGHSLAKKVPVSWSDSTHLRWKTDIPGKGWSSPVVLDGQVWLTTASETGQELFALAFDLASGKLIHRIRVFRNTQLQANHPLNSYASPSPVIETGRVYVHFGAYGTACIDTGSGKILWTRTDIVCDHEVGPGSSPFLYQDLLILTMDGTDIQFLEALDKRSGKTIWKQFRGLDFSHLNFDQKKAFTTPIIAMIDGQEQLISVGPQAVMGYNPLTGKQIWIVRFEGFSASSRPVIGEGILFLNTGFGNSSMMAIRLGGTGDLTQSAILWEDRRNLQARSSPLYINGLLYLVNTGGQAKCMNPKTGEVLWTERVGRQTSASPVFVEGKIYSFDEEGLCTLFKPGKTFTSIAENHLPEGCMASPVPVDNLLIVRTKTSLYCFQ